MASKEECDRYAEELNRRFEELTRWAISNWPDKRFPLVEADFQEGRREIAHIAGARLNDVESMDGNTAPGMPVNEPQFVPVNPAPWP
jgi:hypothetical protein